MSAANIEIYKINQRIIIAKATSSDEPEYYSVIQDVKDNTIYITIPYLQEDPMILARNEQVKLKYITTGAAFVFTSTYLGVHKEESLKLYKIKEPFLEDIQRIQLRRFVRVNLMMDIEYRQFDVAVQSTKAPAPAKRTRRRQVNAKKDMSVPEDDWQKATVADISGSGLRMVLKEKLKTGMILNLHFEIPAKKEMLNVNVKAEVVRCSLTDEDTKLYQASLKFLNVNRSLEDSICSFVFAKQMEQIRKR